MCTPPNRPLAAMKKTLFLRQENSFPSRKVSRFFPATRNARDQWLVLLMTSGYSVDCVEKTTVKESAESDTKERPHRGRDCSLAAAFRLRTRRYWREEEIRWSFSFFSPAVQFTFIRWLLWYRPKRNYLHLLRTVWPVDVPVIMNDHLNSLKIINW